MQTLHPMTINVRGNLMDLSEPKVMGILNVTPDSFFSPSRAQSEREVASRVEKMLEEGADIVDVGGCSTRPGSEPVSLEEEAKRVGWALSIVRKVAPEAVVSVDTFRAEVARCCHEQFGIEILNDISGGEADEKMFSTVADLNIPYVLTHSSDLSSSQEPLRDLLQQMGRKVAQLHEMGVKDVIVDPGFGFGKTLCQNYTIFHQLEVLHALECPLLVGVSRKSMVYKLLGQTPETALNGTTVLHTLALGKGAHILRVHDVRECKEALKILNTLRENA